MQELYMQKALQLAAQAAEEMEVPVGAVIVKDGEIVGEGRNRREQGKHALAHAEIEAIDMACRTLGGWRLSGCEMYVTLEPCPMCAGAIINARIDHVYIGTADPKAGCCGSIVNLFTQPFNHQPSYTYGVCQEACSAQLKTFFRRLRAQKADKSL